MAQASPAAAKAIAKMEEQVDKSGSGGWQGEADEAVCDYVEAWGWSNWRVSDYAGQAGVRDTQGQCGSLAEKSAERIVDRPCRHQVGHRTDTTCRRKVRGWH